MNASSVIAFSMLRLQLYISNLHCFFSSVFSKVFHWTLGAYKATPSSDPPQNRDQKKIENAVTPTSVNYHFTRKCNYKCGFCFHTAKTSFVLPLEEAKRGLKLLKDSGKFNRLVFSYVIFLRKHLSLSLKYAFLFLGMEKINFSGGEPFLHDKGEFLGKLVQYCKQDLQLPSVSIVSNGSMIKEKWFQKYGKVSAFHY